MIDSIRFVSSGGDRGVELWIAGPMAVLLGLAATVSGDDAGTQPASSAVDEITVDDCLTRFPHRRRLASERSGILVQTPEEGDHFEPGAIVARLSDAVPRATLAVAEKKAANDADVRHARKSHEVARFGYDKILAANAARPGTFDADEVQQRELETAERALQVDVAEHDLEVAQLEVTQHRAELKTYEIRSDRGGVVTSVVKRDGEGVQLGEAVLEIVDTEVVRVEGYADGSCRAKLKAGFPVRVLIEVPAADTERPDVVEVDGKLGFVDVSLTSGGEVRVWADVSNPHGWIVEGMRCRMEIDVGSAQAPTSIDD